MEKYRRVEKSKRPEEAAAEPNEIRITQQGKVRNYISYANGLLSEKNERRVVLKAMGNAISKAVTVAEILKHRIAHLHQCTHISSMETIDVYEPLEEGLDRIETKRHIPCISVDLSLDELDTSDPGYQSPLPLELVSTGTTHDEREAHAIRRPARGPRNHATKKPATRRNKQQQVVATSSGDEEAGSSDMNNNKSTSAPADHAVHNKHNKSKAPFNKNERNKPPAKDKDDKKSADASGGEDSAGQEPRGARKKKQTTINAQDLADADEEVAADDDDATLEEDGKKFRAHGTRGGRGRGRGRGNGGRGGRGGRGGGGGGRGDTKDKDSKPPRSAPKSKEATTTTTTTTAAAGSGDEDAARVEEE